MLNRYVRLAVLGTALLAQAATSYSAPTPANVKHQGPQDSSSQQVNPVVQWNRALLVIVRTPGAQPATVHPTRSFAIMHVTIYDAVNAIDRKHRPYLVRLSSVPRDASQEAAAAAPENPRILFQLGRAYAAAKADESARAYFQKASDLGYPPAQANLGTFYTFGRGGLARNDEEALRLYRLAADQGDGLGHNNIGFFYEVGRGGSPKDDNAAVRHYKLAAEAGEAWGQYNVARFREAGRGGLATDEREAARLYRLAADQQHAPAEVSLGFFYQTGRGGLPKDDREALDLYRRAAAQGNAAGQNNVGRFLRRQLPFLAQHRTEIAPIEELHRDVLMALGLAEIKNANDVAVSDLAREEPWRALLSGIDESFHEVPPPGKYQQILREIGFSEIDCYYHTFHHPMQSPAEVVEWYRATGLRPFIDALPEDRRTAFLDSYLHRLESAYGTSGAVTFDFKRLFIWARRPAL